MGLFDFLRKLVKKEEPEIEQEKIDFSEIGDWIKKKREKIESKEKETIILIKEKIKIFSDEVQEKIKVVEKVDIEERKIEEKIKSIVNEGRKRYLESINEFLKSLDGLEKCKLEKFIENINKIFLDFDKSSHMSYERTTILIGKEMAEVKKSLKIFSGDLIKIFNENKDVVENSKIVSLIKLKLDQSISTDEIFKEIKEAIISLDKKIGEKEEANKKILEEIEKINKSEGHIKNLDMQKKIKLLEEELEKELVSLKQIIDFKSLANFFHIFGEQMNLVKDYRDDFQARFKKDNGKEIIKLLDEAKLNNETISEKIKQIYNKKEEIEKSKQEIKKDETQELYSKSTKIILEIGNLKNEKIRDEKRKEKLRVSNEEIIELIKETFEKIGVEII